MANTSSAKKAIRVSARRAVINSKKSTGYKSARKKALKSITSGDSKKTSELMSQAFKAIDKAAKANVIHKNAAARYKSRLAKKVK